MACCVEDGELIVTEGCSEEVGVLGDLGGSVDSLAVDEAVEGEDPADFFIRIRGLIEDEIGDALGESVIET